MARMRQLRLVSRESGATAVEFAIIAPPFLMLLVGIFSATILAFAAASLHYAVEGAARCYSVSVSQCSTATATQKYAQSLYQGPSSPTFAASTPSCGHKVTGTLNYALNAVLAQWTIPLSATACFP